MTTLNYGDFLFGMMGCVILRKYIPDNTQYLSFALVGAVIYSLFRFVIFPLLFRKKND